MSGSITLRRYIKLYEPQFLLCKVNSPNWYSMCTCSVPFLALGLQQWIRLKGHLPLQALHCEVIKRLKWGENIPQCHLSALYVISCHCLREKCERIWRCFLGKSKDEEILDIILKKKKLHILGLRAEGLELHHLVLNPSSAPLSFVTCSSKIEIVIQHILIVCLISAGEGLKGPEMNRTGKACPIS